MSNRLAKETSPYLLQHKDNPVDWYPWGKEAFDQAKREDKPIFLSIGYSACHWCHVLAHESFEDEKTAEILNKYFISVKVDKEERPDIDSVYMTVCQAFTGSGGWPTSIFMTADQKPFFAGTYFPKISRGGMIGFRDLLLAIHDGWETNRDTLLQQAEELIKHLNRTEEPSNPQDAEILRLAVDQYTRVYDKKFGGFGGAPKFPTPHNLLFLLEYSQRHHAPNCLFMAEHTLRQMYRGGLFDHIGFGFCRYSTDEKFLVPHFEKMLYDNALLLLAYCKAYEVTRKTLYLTVAEKIGEYVLREMTSEQGGFYSSQDADSERKEGEYYLFSPKEILSVLGTEIGENFNHHFDITKMGNFEGRNIPNLLKSDPEDQTFEPYFSILADYRKKRHFLHRDEKILTAWNGLMIAAMCELYYVTQKECYLSAAKNAEKFIKNSLFERDTLSVSYHMGNRGVSGFLDDYASYIFALLSLYRTTGEMDYLCRAKGLCSRTISDFWDPKGGFYLYGKEQEELILRPKETYDGAIPSGNSLMTYNLVRISFITEEEEYQEVLKKQIDYIVKYAFSAPLGHGMFLRALLDYEHPPMKITVVVDKNIDKNEVLLSLPKDAIVNFLPRPTKEHPLKNGETTYYVCRGNTCLPPTNDMDEIENI